MHQTWKRFRVFNILLLFVAWLPSLAWAQGPSSTTGTSSKNLQRKKSFTDCVTAKSGDSKAGDDRCDFEASFYVGRVIDTFAGDEVNKYLNPNDTGDVRESYVAGIDVNYRIWASERGELWLFGETVHGIQSKDVDCRKHPDITVCSGKTTTDQQFLYVVRNARSLEAFGGARYEVALSTIHDNVPRIFLETALGFLTVAGTGGDLVNSDTYLAVGVVETDGPFSNSYFSAGIGRSDLFHIRRTRRIKLDGLLSTRVSKSDKVRPFFQMTVDSDRGPSSDSVQFYFGVDVNFRAFAFKF